MLQLYVQTVQTATSVKCSNRIMLAKSLKKLILFWTFLLLEAL